MEGCSGYSLGNNPQYDDDSDYPADAGKGGYGKDTDGYDGAVVIIIS